jgi:hypothetical protein
MYQILERYFALNYYRYGIEEPLNPFYGNYQEERGRVVWERTSNVISQEEYGSTFTDRLNLIKKYHDGVFYKVFPSAFRPEAFKWLCEEHEFVTHERKNIFEQTLSNLLSHSTRHWYSENGIRPENRSLIASKEAFNTFEKSYFHYLQLKRLVKPKAQFFYEDFLNKPPADLLKEAGFEGEFNETNIFLTKKQSPEQKLDVFRNDEEILRWYRESVLQRISPI